MSDAALTLLAPLAGWCTSLSETPDEVFASGLAGDGLAIDPTSGTLCAPCAGEVIHLPASHHAVTLRSAAGAQVLMHIGIDTVALAGEGFQAHVHPGAHVRPGEALISFDLDLLARRARSVLTPVVVSGAGGFRILTRSIDRLLSAGDFLMSLAAAPQAAAGPESAAGPSLRQRVSVRLEHGIHARPAARVVAALRPLEASVRIAGQAREADARSAVALMALGVQRGDEVEIRAAGPDAAEAVSRLVAQLGAEPASPAPQLHASVQAPRAHPAPPGTLRGVSASPGLGCGSAYLLRRAQISVPEHGAGVEEEGAALERARGAVHMRLGRIAGTAARQIAGAHRELLDDPQLLGRARVLIGAGKSAAFAWRACVRESVALLAALSDERLGERADDLLDLEEQVLEELGGAGTPRFAVLPPQAVVIARELLPSQFLALDAERLAGLCMAGGGPTSHVAILAAAAGVPTLVALGPAVLEIAAGRALIVDADEGLLELEPHPARLRAARAAMAAHAAQRAALAAVAQRPGRTADGTRIEVLANVGSLSDARAAVRNGAEGCGLLRTEFLFLDRDTAPGEAEQQAEYQRIADALGARPLTIRTLDAGADKPLAYLSMVREDNPALGLRGVRTSLAFAQLLRTQLRAVLSVTGPGERRVLLPMVTDLEEVRAVRALLDELHAELAQPGAPLRLGVMIETPAAALMADALGTVADFLSIGTNDLSQYTLAMDRGHPQLAARIDAMHPAVLRLIATACAAGQSRGRSVAVCGAAASDPEAAALLVGLGVREFSVVAGMVPQLKARLAAVNLTDCRRLAQRALEAESACAVRSLLRGFSAAQAAP